MLVPRFWRWATGPSKDDTGHTLARLAASSNGASPALPVTVLPVGCDSGPCSPWPYMRHGKAAGFTPALAGKAGRGAMWWSVVLPAVLLLGVLQLWGLEPRLGTLGTLGAWSLNPRVLASSRHQSLASGDQTPSGDWRPGWEEDSALGAGGGRGHDERGSSMAGAGAQSAGLSVGMEGNSAPGAGHQGAHSTGLSAKMEGNSAPGAGHQGARPDHSGGGPQGGSVPDGAGRDSRTVLAAKQRAADLQKAWAKIYKLDGPAPPEEVPPPQSGRDALPWAPHLEECTVLQRLREEAEQHPKEGGYPDWACIGANNAYCADPTPPWIRGVDQDNLPLTRRVQRDVWAHQFPPDCASPNLGFLIVEWGDLQSHGIGSQLHIMTAALSLALHFGRILVPGAYLRADHDECAGFGHRNFWTCYFSPITSDACALEAWRMLENSGAKEPWSLAQSGASKDRVVWVTHEAAEQAATPYVDRFWGKPWEDRSSAFYEILGSVDKNSSFGHLVWWRSQALRFMMRWPLAYLCHLTNKARHATYGYLVALELADAEAQQQALQQGTAGSMPPEERAALELAWSAQSRPLEADSEWRVKGRDEPFMPRPILSMHVRQGDKAREMQLFQFDSYMWMANRMRRMHPGVQYVWLSTEMQSVVDATARFKDWTFFYTEAQRQEAPGVEMWAYERQRGAQHLVGNSFANLVIAAQCDSFVGVLGSNWNRMINELRLTNGRLKAGYMTLNIGWWG